MGSLSAEYKLLEADEYILNPPDRASLYPLQRVDIWNFYKKAQASFWTVEEVDLGTDSRDWLGLTDGERHFIKHVLAFFAAR